MTDASGENHFVLLSLGSNVGDRSRFLSLAVENLRIILSDVKVSSILETEPFGVKEQAKFLNLAISGHTKLSPFALLYFCKTIEYLLGRRVRERWHEREIDIDIILYDEAEISLPLLEIPHSGIAERDFVKIPAMEIEPEAITRLLEKLKIKKSGDKL